jgi:hypothetical protein
MKEQSIEPAWDSMTLCGIAGDMGAGKTITLGMVGCKEFLAGGKIYSNMRLFGLPYIEVKNMEQISQMEKGIFLADELWLYADSRLSASKKNLMVSRILTQSRKHNLSIFYTCQNASQVDKRIKIPTDLWLMPRFLDSNLIKVELFKNFKAIKMPLYFNPILYYCFYNTNEVIFDLETGDDKMREFLYHFRDNTAWIDFLANHGIYGKEAVKLSNTLEKSLLG